MKYLLSLVILTIVVSLADARCGGKGRHRLSHRHAAVGGCSTGNCR